MQASEGRSFLEKKNQKTLAMMAHAAGKKRLSFFPKPRIADAE
jgi:hypothetical protein